MQKGGEQLAWPEYVYGITTPVEEFQLPSAPSSNAVVPFLTGTDTFAVVLGRLNALFGAPFYSLVVRNDSTFMCVPP